MSRSYGEDLRARVIGVVQDGGSARSAAARFEIGVATAVRWCRQWRETGDYRSKPRGNPGSGSKLDTHASFILSLVDDACDISLVEIGERLSHERGVSASPATLSRFFRRRRITVKKRRRMPPSRSATT